MSGKRKSVLSFATDANEQLPEHKCPLTEEDKKIFHGKHSFTKPQRCRCKHPGGDLAPCWKDPTFSPLGRLTGANDLHLEDSALNVTSSMLCLKKQKSFFDSVRSMHGS